jgi:hypothetical protein
MELKNKLILIAIVIAIIFCGMPGVSAYSLLYSGDLKSTISSSIAYMPNDAFYIFVRNADSFNNVTHFVVSNVAGTKTGNLTQTRDNCPLRGTDGFDHGTGNVTYTWDKLGSGGRGTYTVDINNFNPLGNVGAKSYRFVCSPNLINEALIYDMGAQWPASPALPSVYAATVSNNNNNVLNATYAFYSGSPDLPPVNATLNVKEVATGTPISGAAISISNGQSGYTDINGNLTLSITPPSADYTVNVTKAGYQNLSNWYLGPAGLTGGYAIFTMTPNGVAGNVTIYVRLKDSESPYPLISGSTISIKNNTWYNQTAPTGALAISGADTGGLSALSVGQTITVCGSATGYSNRCDSLTIPYSGYIHSMYLTRTALEPSYGNSNLIVTVKRNLDAQPVTNGHVTVQTGVSGPGTYEGGTDDNGVASFFNLSASSTALINIVAQGYQPGSAIVGMSPNSTTRVTIELVRIGDTPVATPIVPTGTPGYVTIKPTTPIYPTSTSAIQPNPSWTPGGTTGHYSGFFGPIANWFDAMGAGTEFIGTLLAVVFIFIGAAIGGWSSAPYSSNAVFNPVAAGIGALLGFLVAVAAGLISLTLVVIFIFAAIFIAIFFR